MAAKRTAHRNTTWRCRLAGVLLASGLPAVGASAGEGVLEIHPACATTTGCFTGDAPGMPIEITRAGSYRLTAHLPLAGGLQAIVITADDVTLDLGGFTIDGPGSCSGTPPVCSGTGGTSGILGGNASRVTVRNGHIRGVAFGVNVGVGGRVEGLTVAEVANAGIIGQFSPSVIVGNVVTDAEAFAIAAASGSRVADNVVRHCGTFGVIGGSSVSIEGNVVSGCGTAMISVEATAGNACDDGSCQRVPAAHYYLTPDPVAADAALAACEAGFHMAALHEILDPTPLRYDVARGATSADSGRGPPSGRRGWVRTGNDATTFVGSHPGVDDCANWTNGTAGSSGTAVYLREFWSGTSEPISPSWQAVALSCATTTVRVWCIED